jgi:hypothetical protein
MGFFILISYLSNVKHFYITKTENISMKSKKTNSLKYLMNEVISEKRLAQRINTNTIKFTTLDESAINSLLDLDIFTVNEAVAVRILFGKTKTKSLTESTIKKLDKSVKTIVESVEGDAILSEGFFGDIWDGLKGLGDKAKEALSGGWGKVKAIWGEFTELVTEVAAACKDGFQKAFGSFAQKAKAEAAKIGDAAKKGVDKITDKVAFAKEVKELLQSVTYVTTTFFDKWIAKPTWEKDVIAGSVAPTGDVKVDAAKAEDGLEDLKTMESFNKIKLNLIKERNDILLNVDVIKELLNSSNSRLFLMEGGGFAHLEGAIKNPFLKGVVEWSVKIIQAVFIPIAKIAQVVAAMVGKELLKKFSEGVKMLGGPGVFGFAIITGLLSEALELAVKGLTPNGPFILGLLFPPLAPIVAAAEGLIVTVKGALTVYTYATMFINIVPVLQLLEKGKTESYNPRGEFKIQDGNLLYIK